MEAAGPCLRRPIKRRLVPSGLSVNSGCKPSLPGNPQALHSPCKLSETGVFLKYDARSVIATLARQLGTLNLETQLAFVDETRTNRRMWNRIPPKKTGRLWVTSFKKQDQGTNMQSPREDIGRWMQMRVIDGCVRWGSRECGSEKEESVDIRELETRCGYQLPSQSYQVTRWDPSPFVPPATQGTRTTVSSDLQQDLRLCTLQVYSEGDCPLRCHDATAFVRNDDRLSSADSSGALADGGEEGVWLLQAQNWLRHIGLGHSAAEKTTREEALVPMPATPRECLVLLPWERQRRLSAFRMLHSELDLSSGFSTVLVTAFKGQKWIVGIGEGNQKVIKGGLRAAGRTLNTAMKRMQALCIHICQSQTWPLRHQRARRAATFHSAASLLPVTEDSVEPSTHAVILNLEECKALRRQKSVEGSLCLSQSSGPALLVLIQHLERKYEKENPRQQQQEQQQQTVVRGGQSQGDSTPGTLLLVLFVLNSRHQTHWSPKRELIGETPIRNHTTTQNLGWCISKLDNTTSKLGLLIFAREPFEIHCAVTCAFLSTRPTFLLRKMDPLVCMCLGPAYNLGLAVVVSRRPFGLGSGLSVIHKHPSSKPTKCALLSSLP
ncbi:hypothetical protein ACRRTK_019411 [Alexandromys fortis]